MHEVYPMKQIKKVWRTSKVEHCFSRIHFGEWNGMKLWDFLTWIYKVRNTMYCVVLHFIRYIPFSKQTLRKHGFFLICLFRILALLLLPCRVKKKWTTNRWKKPSKHTCSHIYLHFVSKLIHFIAEPLKDLRAVLR